MTKETRRIVLGTFLAFLLLALFLRGVDFQALRAAFETSRRGPLVACVVATIFVYMVRAWRWGYLLRPLVRVRFRDLLSATFIGFMAGLVIPRSGELLRPYLVARRHGGSISAAFASIVLERLVDLLTVLALFGLYLYALPAPTLQTSGPPDVLAKRAPLLGLLEAAGVATALGAAAIVAVLWAFHTYGDRAREVLMRWLRWLPARLLGIVSDLMRAFHDGLAVLKAPAHHWAAIMLQSFLLWLMIALAIHFINRAFELPLPFHAAFLIVGFLTVGVAIPTPGNVGGFHEGYREALTRTYGIDDATAVAAGIMAHALMNLPVLLGGLLALRHEGLRLRNVAEMTGRAEADRLPHGEHQ